MLHKHRYFDRNGREVDERTATRNGVLRQLGFPCASPSLSATVPRTSTGVRSATVWW